MNGNEGILNGVTVLVTRPEGQGETLCALIEAAGGRAVSLPVIAIRTLDDPERRAQLEAAVAGCDAFIFVSRNAVGAVLALLPDLASRLADRLVCATGAGTRQALQEAGVRRVMHTEAAGASEALLEQPELAAERVAGMRIALVRGEGGRELLPEELARRGAVVRRIEVYRRERPPLAVGTMNSLWQDSRPDVIVITSVTGLHHLIELTPVEWQPALYSTPLAVIGERIGTAAREAGFTGAVAVADRATDEALARAVTALRSGSR